MRFIELYDFLLIEAFQISFLKRIDSEISIIASKYKKTDKAKFKEILKVFKKRIISKLIKENYDGLRDKYFPFLANESRTMTDGEFEKNLYETPEIWENINRESFEEFLLNIDVIINYFAHRNYSEMGNLSYLKKAYLRY